MTTNDTIYGPSINGRRALTQGARNHYNAVLEAMFLAVDGVSDAGIEGLNLTGSMRIDNEIFVISLSPDRNRVSVSTRKVRGSKRISAKIAQIKEMVGPLMTPYSTVKAA